MKKKQLSMLLNFASRSEVIALGEQLEGKYEVQTLKKPRKTLVMLKLRESAKNSLFYAGEALVCECMVKIKGVGGFAAALGDDFEKVYSMAIIDAVMNLGDPEQERISAIFRKWESQMDKARARDSKIAMSTKVDFNIMEQ